MIAWLVASAALAQEPLNTCEQPFTRIQLGAALGQIHDALEDQDFADARDRLNVVGDRLPCLDEVVERDLFGKFARYMSIVYFFAQEEDGALRWGLAARKADPALEWDPARFPGDHPLRVLVDNAPDPMVGTIGGQGLAPPRGGGVFMNGRWASEPTAHAELPYLVQVFDDDARRVDAWWQDGSAFPDQILSRPRTLEPPGWYQVDPNAPEKVKATVTRAPDPPPPARPKKDVPVVPIVASSALALTSGVTYFLADRAAASMPDQRTPEDLTATRSRANVLVLASGVSLAGAVGFGIAGAF